MTVWWVRIREHIEKIDVAFTYSTVDSWMGAILLLIYYLGTVITYNIIQFFVVSYRLRSSSIICFYPGFDLNMQCNSTIYSYKDIPPPTRVFSQMRLAPQCVMIGVVVVCGMVELHFLFKINDQIALWNLIIN